MHHLTKIGKSSLFISLIFMCSILAGSVRARAAASDVEVMSSVDRNQLSPDDTFQLTISVSSSEDVTVSQPTLPPINDFEILNEWTGTESRTSFVSGSGGMKRKTVQTTNYNFLLQPKREGTLTIGGAEVVVDGHSHVTKPITVKVGAGLGVQKRGRQALPGAAPGGGMQLPPGFGDDEDADDLFSQLLRRGMGMGTGEDPTQGATGSRTLPINPNDAFFVQVETDKKEAYVGEQVTVSFYLYTRGLIRDLDTLKYPSLHGFWKEDIEIATHLNFTNEVVNGLPYKKALLASFALFPITEGETIIDSYTAKCSVSLSGDTLGALGYGKAYTYTKSSTPLKIKVKPLPVEGRPADYSGAVGDFQVTANVEDKNIVSNQPFTYKVRFEGKGNAKLIELPAFNPPDGLEQYDIQKDAKFFRTGTSYKDFAIQLIPRREGEFTIPPLSVSIFDPVRKAYVNKSTDPVRVIVAKGSGPTIEDQMMKNGQAGGSGGTTSKVDQPPALLVEMKHPIGLTRAEFAIGFPVLMLLIFGILGAKAKTELGWGAKKADLQRRLRARLRRVDQRVVAGDWRGVGVEMTNAVYFVLGEISGEGGASTELDKLMKKAPPSVRRELSAPLAKQMDIFQVLSFAPESVVGDLKNPERLRIVVSDMSQLMEKAVQLGLSSGQTDEESSEKI
jgi:hypothetical protein